MFRYRSRAGIEHVDGSYTEFECEYTYTEGDPSSYNHPVEPELVEIQAVSIVKSIDPNKVSHQADLGKLSLTLDEILDSSEMESLYIQLLIAVQTNNAEVIS